MRIHLAGVFVNDQQKALRFYTETLGFQLKHNIPFHINLLNSISFMAGKFDTTFVERRFNMNTYEQDPTPGELETVAIAATLYAHHKRRLASQVVAPAKRDASNWKWMARFERMHR